MQSRFRIALALLLVVLTVGALAACSGDDSSEAQDDPANAAVGEEDPEGTEGEAESPAGNGSSGEENTIVASGLAWSPNKITVDTGAEVAVDNQDSTEHTFTVEGTSIDQDLAAGASVDVTIDLESGDYEWVCEIHPSMTGDLTVS